MKKFTTWLCLFLMTSCGLLNSKDEAPDIPGKVVFSAKDEAGTNQIYTMKANGTEVRQLTDWEQTSSIMPSWSPDGEQILFSSFKSGNSIGPALWVMNEDGSNKHLLDYDESNPFPLLGNNAQWSPDGSKVVFDLCLNCQLETNNDIYLFDLKSKELTKLTKSHANDMDPVWSPDGDKIAFVSNRDYVDADTLRFRKDLYAINSDGSKLQRLTNFGFAKDPVWHKKMDLIILRSIGSTSGIYKLDLNTSKVELVKKDIKKGMQLHPVSWSVDGSKVLITNNDVTNKGEDSLEVYDIEKEEIVSLYTSRNILYADWYISKK